MNFYIFLCISQKKTPHFSNNNALSTYNTLVLKRFAYVLSQFIPTTI